MWRILNICLKFHEGNCIQTHIKLIIKKILNLRIKLLQSFFEFINEKNFSINVISEGVNVNFSWSFQIRKSFDYINIINCYKSNNIKIPLRRVITLSLRHDISVKIQLSASILQVWSGLWGKWLFLVAFNCRGYLKT